MCLEITGETQIAYHTSYVLNLKLIYKNYKLHYKNFFSFHQAAAEMRNIHKKSILYTVYRYSQIFAQNIQHTYTLRILENIQFSFISKRIFNIHSEYTLKNY